MSTSYTNTTTPGFLRFPDVNADEAELGHYFDRHFNRHSTYRTRHMARMVRNIYYWLGRQWIEVAYSLTPTGAGFTIKDSKSRVDSQGVRLPQPVTNICAPAVEVEMAALGKRQWTANVIADSKDPRIEAAAREAKRILDYRNRCMDFPTERERHIFFLSVCGTAITKSFWDEDYNKLIAVASPEAVVCPSCQARMFSPTIDKSQLETLGQKFQGLNTSGMEELEPSVEQGFQVKLNNCPLCTNETQPLQPYDVGQHELDDQDIFGRHLGMDIPKGQTNLESVLPMEFYPENQGAGVEPDSMRVFGQKSIRSLEWVEDHYGDIVNDIDPMPRTELLAEHPIMGDWDVIHAYDSALDVSMYDNHTMVEELYYHPSRRCPEGRSVVRVGKKLFPENGALLRKTTYEGQDIMVSKVHYGVTRWKKRPGEFWGHALIDDLVSIQNRINGLDAQIIEARSRMGSPNVMLFDDMELKGPEFLPGYGNGKFLRVTRSNFDPQAKPEIFGAITMPSGAWQERESLMKDAPRVAGPQEIELGEAPRNVTTTTGLQLLGEQAERRRAQREFSLISTFEDIWSHTLQLEWVLRSDEEEYELETEGIWDRKQYNRNIIAGQTKVRIEKQAYIDKSIFQREAVREAQEDGLVVADSPAARKRILELRGLPTDVNEDVNRQVEYARRKWLDFVDEGVVPVVDYTLDNHPINYNIMGTMLLTDEGLQIADQVGWKPLSQMLANWEEDLQQAETVDAMVVQAYGGRLSPEEGQEAYARMMLQYQQVLAATEAQTQAVQQAVGAGAPPPTTPSEPPPQEPPKPVFLPPGLYDRILLVWTKRLQGQNPKEMPPPVGPYLLFRACYETHRLLAQREAAAAAAPPPGPPGSGSTMAPEDKGSPDQGQPAPQ